MASSAGLTRSPRRTSRPALPHEGATEGHRRLGIRAGKNVCRLQRDRCARQTSSRPAKWGRVKTRVDLRVRDATLRHLVIHFWASWMGPPKHSSRTFFFTKLASFYVTNPADTHMIYLLSAWFIIKLSLLFQNPIIFRSNLSFPVRWGRTRYYVRHF